MAQVGRSLEQLAAPRPQPAAEAPGEIALSVLVPILNEQRHIRGAIDAMRAQRFDGAVEFLLLDGGSTDATLAELERLVADDPRFRIVRVDGANVPERLNRGLRLARGELIARMDAHAVFPTGYLADGRRRLARGDVASVSGPQIASGDGIWSRRIAIALRSRLGRGGAQFRHLSAGEIEVDSGYCGVWRRSLLVAHGGWNELAPSGEDMELAARISRSGGRIVCVPEMAARYLPRDSLHGLALQYGRYAYRRAWVARRHGFALRRSHLLPPTVLLTAICAAAAPAPLARFARVAATLYVLSLIGESIRIGRDEPFEDAVALPVVFATTHLAWGAGFVLGCLRHGVPWAALRSAVGAQTASRVPQTPP